MSTTEHHKRRWVTHPIIQNIAALFSVQIAGYVIPLLLVPYLARVLGPAGWGRLALAQAFAGYQVLVIEFGFGLSAVREVARHRDSPERLAELLGSVNGAKLILGLICGCVVLALSTHLEMFRGEQRLVWAAYALALCQGCRLVWYFQGLERMKLISALDFASRLIAAVLTIVAVRMPGQEWRALGLQALGALMASAAEAWVAWHEVPFLLPRWSDVAGAIRLSASMFLFRSAVSLYTVGNAFILGFFVSPQLVGYYAGAEKINKAALNFVQAASTAVYPRLNHLIRCAPPRAARLARISFSVMGGGGAIMGLCTWIGAPELVKLILGAGYEPAVGILRVLAALPMLNAASNVLGILWMLPLGLDRIFNFIILAAGAVNLLLGITLAPRFAGMGMAVSVVTTEGLVVVAMLLYLIRRGPNPFRPGLEMRERVLVSSLL